MPQFQVLDEYFESLRTQDWQGLARCLAEGVHRSGPYLDVIRGRPAYVDYLAKVIPALAGYDLKVARVRALAPDCAVAELSEFAEVGGVRREFPELILFDFDETGSIARIDIYMKQPPRHPQ